MHYKIVLSTKYNRTLSFLNSISCKIVFHGVEGKTSLGAIKQMFQKAPPPLLQGHDISVNKCLLFTGDNTNFIKGALFLDFLSNSYFSPTFHLFKITFCLS